MKRLLITATLLLITALFISGIYYPQSPLMWLASTNIEYTYLRAAVMLTLIVLLFSNPPRSLFFRASLLALSSFIGVVIMSQIESYQIQIVDAIVLSEVAILLAIEGLEISQKKSITPINRTLRTNKAK